MGDDIQSRVERIRQRVADAAGRVGREPSDVRLLAVTKKIPPETIAEAAACGLDVFGENRVQEATQKIPLCPGHLEWHMVGHLQSNKARAAVGCFGMIHSVDSLRLLETLNRCCEEAGKDMPLCLEVNVSGESSKYGLAPDDVPPLLGRCLEFPRVSIVGLMTMPPFTEDPADARPYFRTLREMRDEWQQACDVGLPELSMGMSRDFEVAVEEGATWIRLGTILFKPAGGQ